MKTAEIDIWFKKILEIENFSIVDPSKNGLQVDNDGADITRIAFAVDACQASISRALTAGAGMLFVHHGLFWKESECLTGIHYKRIKTLLDNNLALYACHLPLDAHTQLGHNAGIAQRLGLKNIEPFGEWRGKKIGYKGLLSEMLSIDTIIQKMYPEGQKPLHVLPFGPKKIQSVGIVSGGASDEVWQAMDEKLDLYITGEISHEIYHPCLEKGISVIAGGHYQTETFGLRLLAEKILRDTGIDTIVLDIPTGL